MRGAGLALLALVSACAPSPPPLAVFAAASLGDVAEAVPTESGRRVRVTIGATSLLSQQIARGAPADVFVAAAPVWVDRVVEAGRGVGAPVEVARGRLVIVARAGTPRAGSALAALGGAGRVALADPSHVPAGQYARAALRSGRAWGAVRDRVVATADVRAALAAVQRGAADAAVVYASDALAAPDLAVVYRFSASETPTVRYVGIVTSADPDAAAWLRAFRDSTDLWRRHGFEPTAP